MAEEKNYTDPTKEKFHVIMSCPTCKNDDADKLQWDVIDVKGEDLTIGEMIDAVDNGWVTCLVCGTRYQPSGNGGIQRPS